MSLCQLVQGWLYGRVVDGRVRHSGAGVCLSVCVWGGGNGGICAHVYVSSFLLSGAETQYAKLNGLRSPAYGWLLACVRIGKI